MSQGFLLASPSPRQSLKEQITYTSRLEAKGKPRRQQNLQGGFSVPRLPWVSLTGSFERLWKRDGLVGADGKRGPRTRAVLLALSLIPHIIVLGLSRFLLRKTPEFYMDLTR